MLMLIDKLNKKIKEDPYFLDENKEVIKDKVKTSILNLDDHIMDILLKDDDFKKAFFVEKNKILVFDKVKFSWIINNSKFLPDSYTSYKNKIGLIDSNSNFLKNNDDVVISFPYKDCVLEFDSTNENEDRNEVFLNEILAKDYIDTLFSNKVFINPVLHSHSGNKKINKFIDGNLLIKGNNLIALYSLLGRYENKIKLMYWDILYNTNSDNVPYNDKFKHSSWLTMMKNRLEVAKRLLNPINGSIVLQCDDNEQAYLKVLCDEVFGRENFVNCICVKMSDASGPKMAHIEKRFPKLKEYLLIYKKDLLKINAVKEQKKEWDNEYKNFLDLSQEEIKKIISETDKNEIEKINKMLPLKLLSLDEAYKKYKVPKKNQKDFCFKNAFRIARTSNAATIKRAIEETQLTKNIQLLNFKNQNIFVKADFDRNASDPRVQYVFAEETINVPLCDLWLNVNTSFNSEGGVTLKNGQKPEYLLQLIIKALSNEGDVVLDAYFGTGTTGAVAMKLNRQFIGIEQLDSHYELALKRIQNVLNGEQSGISEEVNWKGGGSFVSFELASENMSLINEVNKVNESSIDELFEKISSNPFFLNYKIDCVKLNDVKNKADFLGLSLEDKKKFLIEILDKNLLYINYSEIDDKNKKIVEDDKAFSKSFYGQKL